MHLCGSKPRASACATFESLQLCSGKSFTLALFPTAGRRAGCAVGPPARICARRHKPTRPARPCAPRPGQVCFIPTMLPTHQYPGTPLHLAPIYPQICALVSPHAYPPVPSPTLYRLASGPTAVFVDCLSCLPSNRFDKLEYLGVNQSPEGRAAVLRAATRRYTLGPDVDFKTLAAGAPGGMTGADLAAVARAAARIAVDRRIVAIKQFLGT